MKFSIVIAAYNVEDYINKNIEMCLNTKRTDYEIIVIDDGSTDKTKKILENYVDSRLIVKSIENKGVNNARQVGINLAKGEYILLVDGDDYININNLFEVYDRCVKQNYDIGIFNYTVVWENGKEKKFIFKNIGDSYLKDMLIGDTPYLWCKLIKKDFLFKYKLKLNPELRYAEDLAFSVIMGLYKPKVAYISKYVYYYLQRDEAVTKKIDDRILDIDKSINYINKEMKEKNIEKTLNAELEFCRFKYQYMNRIYNIFGEETIYSKQLFNTWKSKKIYIEKNKYFRKRINWKIKIFYFISNFNYFIGKKIFNYIK